jgi:hypothetical protein
MPRDERKNPRIEWVVTLNRAQLRPCEHSGLIRLGPARDGGYVVPEAQVRDAAVLLSLGVNEDWSFDRAFAALNPNARVIAVDHTVGPAWFVRRTAEGLLQAMGQAVRGAGRRTRKPLAVARNSIDYFRFFSSPHRHIAKRVGTSDTGMEITIGRLIELAGAGDHGVFLKMDVDGSEYGLVADIAGAERQINCVVGEFHGLTKRTALFNDAIARLLAHFRIVHVHGNNYGAYDAANDFPDAVEITLVNRALMPADVPPSREDYPRRGLDYPNHPRRPDYALRFD